MIIITLLYLSFLVLWQFLHHVCAIQTVPLKILI